MLIFQAFNQQTYKKKQQLISPCLFNYSENNVRFEFKNEILELRPLHGILHGNIRSKQKN